MSAFLPDQTRISQVHLRTSRLAPALAFYSGVLGLKVLKGPGPQAIVSAAGESPALIVLSEDRNAAPPPPHSTGLYHFGLRYPRREDLAHAYRRLLTSGYPIVGASNHGVSEAIYLSDADGNGIELYADRPRAQWSFDNGQIAMVTRPLDLDNLLATSQSEFDPAVKTVSAEIGHLHLHVADLAVAERFYGEFLGLSVTQRSCPGALFFSATGYRHHIGVDTWAGKAPAPVNSLGLISYRLEVPLAEVLYCLSHRAPLLGYKARIEKGKPTLLKIVDPNGNCLEVHCSSASAEVRHRAHCRLAAKEAAVVSAIK